MEDIEDGECSSDGDSIAGYTPIERPTDAKPSFKPADILDDTDDDDEDESRAHQDDSDSDEDRPAAKRMNKTGLWGRRDALVPEPTGNETFKMMAAAFQADRKSKKKNNIWGTIIQEESLNSTLSGFGVNRSLKDLGSDRGAETYDFTIPLEEKAKERQRQKEARKKDNKLEEEMDNYWGSGGPGDTMEETESQPVKPDEGSEEVGEKEEGGEIEEGKGEEKRGTKRSAKERLGKRRVPIDRYNGERLAAPGDAKHLIDIGEEDLLENSDKEFAQLLADRLGEEKPELLEGLVFKFGKTLAHKLYKLTQKTEAAGGLEINNGARRRTSGGVYLFLLKTDPSLGIDHEAVRVFLADSKKKEDRRILEARKRKKKKDFNKEMKDFLILRQNIAEKKVQEMEEDGGEEKTEMEEKEEEIEELVEIGNNPFAKIIGSLASKNAQKERLVCDQEPGPPPNSVERVERTLQEYDDDLFCTTDDIELS
ncbi:phosphorylated adapter RNA export protein [Eurytemora carolleeae]|uniref:phosphorylated adapter RNA export protein n=1 Tax=Eurytemora carolleeae TaxID=1294199 RepID=UPI000C76A3E0|nr:phosphorylated adapter RNA export protein [Eurytemora carolleeae]|eukprot:XP_023320111.1 phosphorylated adapter RNA export protein-like [Eurytemora affinis]